MQKYKYYLALLLCLVSTPAWSMDHYSNVAQDQNGRAITGATITVYLAGTTGLAQIYSDNGVTAKANPFATAIDGIYDFYAADGRYDITITKSGYTSIYWDPNKLKGLTLFDPAQFIAPYGAAFPTNPFDGAWFVLTGDDGSCTPASGGSSSICRFDGAGWIAIGGGSSSDTLQAVAGRGNTSTGNDEANPFEILGTGGQAGYGLSIDRTSSGETRFRCKEPAGLNKCDYYRSIDDTFEGGFKDKDGVKRLTVSGTTGALTNVTLDAEGSGNTITLPFEWDLDLCAINPTDSSLSFIWNRDPLSGPPTLTAKTGTNRDTCVATFPDADGDYGVSIRRRLPTGWTGNFDAEIWWDTTGTGTAVFQVATKCYAHNEADDASYNTATSTAVSAGTSGRPNSVSIPNITMTGCAGGKLVQVRVFRNRTNGGDTLNAALNVEKVVFTGRAAR